MSITEQEAEELILKAQNVNELNLFDTRMVEFYTQNPERLRGRTLEEMRAQRGNAVSVYWDEDCDLVTVDGVEVEKVDSYGGEGQGDDLWVVYRVGNQLFRIDGYYSSYDGGSWDEGELYEVEPYEVSVTHYRKVK